MLRFENKVVIVTGASRGIGQAIAVAFAREGATVVGVARSDLAETARRQSQRAANSLRINADLSKGTQKEAADLVATNFEADRAY